MENALSILLVEDDPIACGDIVSCVDNFEDLVLIAVTNNASKAASIIQDSMPDAVILDLELHHGSGSGLSLLRDLKDSKPSKMPYVLITTNNSSTITYEAARQLGADFIFSKHQDGYSAKTVVEFLRMMKNVIKSHSINIVNNGFETESPEQKSKRLSRRISAELDRIGISPKATGYQYLVDGIQIVVNAPTQNLCNIIGQKYGKTESSVERAMQNAIAKAWRTTPIDDLLQFYTAKISSEKGIPTITEFIYYYANKLKNEY